MIWYHLFAKKFRFFNLTKDEDPIPKVTYKPPPVAPKEAYGTGVNKYVYYVCNARNFFDYKMLIKNFT